MNCCRKRKSSSLVTAVITLGMYASAELLEYTFSFTWGLPKYWPLDPPQAIIVTLGLDEGYSGLADWLLEYDFQAVACYPIMSELNLNEWAAILYTLPELNLSVYAQNCAPEMLAWLDN